MEEEKYDLAAMLAEIKEDEQQLTGQAKAHASQEEIKKMLKKRKEKNK